MQFIFNRFINDHKLNFPRSSKKELDTQHSIESIHVNTFEAVFVVMRPVGRPAAMSLTLLKFAGQASLVDEAMLPS